MSFIADKQTLDDLGILGKYKSYSIFNLFNHTITDGGQQLLTQLFKSPLTDADRINERVRLISYFTIKTMTLPFSREAFHTMEDYLRSGGGSLLETAWVMVIKKFRNRLVGGKEDQQEENALKQTIQTLQAIRGFVNELRQNPDNPFMEKLVKVYAVLSGKEMQWLQESFDATPRQSLWKQIKQAHCLRTRKYKELKELLQLLYEFDVYIAVAGVAVARGFCFPRALPATENSIRIIGLHHPLLDQAVPNPAYFNEQHNMVFLTGANMAGKSTYMKSFGVALYLAHMGFPVAAADMEFSVKNGIFTTINIPDDLKHGYSHFYAEVLRVKTVAETIRATGNLVVIFDELFKGTNVKDAYDATLTIAEALAAKRSCCFIISTHITEVGTALRERRPSVRFLYMPTVMQGEVPAYTYQLQEGISTDRQGMMIIENEKIIELIRLVG